MNRRKTFTLLFLILALSIPQLYADFDYADSPEFHLNLLTLEPPSTYDYADSVSFTLNLYPVNRDSSDSNDFNFNWLSNCDVNPASQQLTEYEEVNFLQQLNTSGQWVTPFSFPDIDDEVVIINHGWNDSPDSFKDLGMLIAARVPQAFIYTWHWGDGPNQPSDANPNGLDAAADFAEIGGCFNFGRPELCLIGMDNFNKEVQKTMTNAIYQGKQLGKRLFEAGIGPDRQKIHMIGHSFGGLVCSEAAKVLKDKTSGSKVLQITLLDTPGITGVADAASLIDTSAAVRTEALYYYWSDDMKFGGTGGPVPIKGSSNVLNFKLNALNYMPPWLLHTKALEWYEESVSEDQLNYESQPYGFGWSITLDPFDPNWPGTLPTGNFKETEFNKGCMVPFSELVERARIKVVKIVEDSFNSAASWYGQQATIVMDSCGQCYQFICSTYYWLCWPHGLTGKYMLYS